MGGVVRIDVNHAHRNLTPPPVAIEIVRIDKTAIERDNAIRVPGGTGDLEIRYTGLSFLSPGKVRFRYRLEGFDAGWVKAGRSRTARYPNLPPGNYRFRVMACNNDGVWNEQGASFAFTLLPVFYRTWWFYGLCGIVLAGFTFGMHRIRVKRLKVREKDLERRVEERTAELQQQIEVRQKTEIALRQAEEKYRGIFEEAILA